MTFGDQGMPYGQPQPYGPPHQPYGPPDPYAQWVAEQERIRRRRRTRLVVVGAVGAVLAVAVAAGAVMVVGGGEDDETSAPPASTAPATSPAATPSAASSPPVVHPEQAFPEKSVRLKDGSRYERVDLATTTRCADGMSQELASFSEKGSGCLQLTSALFTDAERRSQVTVTVVTYRRAEDAMLVFGMAAMDPVTYQVVSLDPPPQAGLPTVPPGSAGVFRRLMTVRSVVFANGQWGDGAETKEAELTRQTEGLLQYVDHKVAAFEQGAGV